MWTKTFSLLLLSLQVSESVYSDILDYAEIQNITAVPYLVLVFFNNNKYFCSGTIVNPMWVLTAAHCVFDVGGEYTEDAKSITVVAGANSIYFTQEDVQSGKVQIRQSVAIKIHSSYSWYESFVNDLVIIQVKEQFMMTERVQMAPRGPPGNGKENLIRKQPTNEKIKPYQSTSSCQGFGFGKVLREENSNLDFWLKAQQYEVEKECLCLRRVRSIRVPYNILKKKNNYLCDTPGLRTGLCKGDNGGPLVCDGWLRGISSATVLYKDIKECTLWRDGQQNNHYCGAITTVSLFTDLCSHNLWLRENIPDYPSINETCNPNPDHFSGRSFY